jgi:hypothetical protein
VATLVTVEHRSDWFTHRVMVEKPTSIAPASSIPATLAEMVEQITPLNMPDEVYQYTGVPDAVLSPAARSRFSSSAWC